MTDLARSEPQFIDIIQRAVSEKLPADELERLLGVYERMQAKTAEQDFNVALASFQREINTIIKNRQVDFVSQKGGRVKYSFVDLENLIDQLRPVLERHGFAFSHDTIINEGQMMTATCTLRHIKGHREQSSFTLPTTAQTSLMSDQQRYAAALTFARRYTLIQILGLATGDEDPDAMADPTLVSESQMRQLNDALIDADADVHRFCVYMGVERLSEIRAADFERAWQAIEAKKRGK